MCRRLWIQGNKAAHTQLVDALAGRKSALSVSNGKVVIGLGPVIGDVKARLAARGLTLVSRLPLLTLALLAAGVYVARRHRRALIGAGLGLAASMLVLAIALALGRAIYLSKVPAGVLPADAAAVAFDTIVRFIRQGCRW